jgi:hypothetical protein
MDFDILNESDNFSNRPDEKIAVYILLKDSDTKYHIKQLIDIGIQVISNLSKYSDDPCIAISGSRNLLQIAISQFDWIKEIRLVPKGIINP